MTADSTREHDRTVAVAKPRDGSRNLKRFAIGALVFAVLLATFIGVLAERCLRELVVTGQVVDVVTGDPVPYARVVVARGKWRWVIHYPTGYAITADEEGRFQIETGVTRGVGGVWVSASSPNNDFAQIRWTGNPVLLQTAPLDSKYSDRQYMEYRHFAGGSGVVSGGMTFLDEGWELPPRR